MEKMEVVTLLVAADREAPAEGPHILLEASAPTRAEAAAQAMEMAGRGSFGYIFALDNEGNIPTA